jgi:hydroxymethylpyrimidine pyrophosphatase-like HAD family hydrolase
MNIWNAIAAFDLDGTLLNDEKQITPSIMKP